MTCHRVMMHDISALNAMNTLYHLGVKDQWKEKKKSCKSFILHDTEIIDYSRNLYIEADEHVGQQCMLFQSIEAISRHI